MDAKQRGGGGSGSIKVTGGTSVQQLQNTESEHVLMDPARFNQQAFGDPGAGSGVTGVPAGGHGASKRQLCAMWNAE